MSLSILKSIANTKTFNRFEKWAAKETPIRKNSTKTISNYSKLQDIYPTVFMLLTIGAQTAFIYNDKDMPKERRIPLVLNNIINCAISVGLFLLMSKSSKKFVNKTLERANVLYANNPNKTKLINGINTAVPFVVSAFLFKYIGPVAATPLADKANKFLVKKGIVKYSNNQDK